ncbi:2-C-methyl-D-erythritol 4-phosphate cytidylyltransferase [bacterium]|nr:2-C-methyl-D-erythritol 4-phosphate cytidylyltransferase [bacterium]
MKTYAIILASSGKRFGGNLPKQFIKISRKTILERTLDIFDGISEIDFVILVVNSEYSELVRELINSLPPKTVEFTFSDVDMNILNSKNQDKILVTQ